MKEFIYLNKASTADRVISFDQIWRKNRKLVLKRQQMVFHDTILPPFFPPAQLGLPTHNVVPQVYRGFFIALAEIQSTLTVFLLRTPPTVTSNPDPLWACRMSPDALAFPAGSSFRVFQSLSTIANFFVFAFGVQ